jgi:hypothetical protein
MREENRHAGAGRMSGHSRHVVDLMAAASVCQRPLVRTSSLKCRSPSWPRRAQLRTVLARTLRPPNSVHFRPVSFDQLERVADVCSLCVVGTFASKDLGGLPRSFLASTLSPPRRPSPFSRRRVLFHWSRTRPLLPVGKPIPIQRSLLLATAG